MASVVGYYIRKWLDEHEKAAITLMKYPRNGPPGVFVQICTSYLLADFIISQKDKEVNLCVNKKGV